MTGFSLQSNGGLSRLLLGQWTNFHGFHVWDRFDVAGIRFTPADVRAFLSLYWFTVAFPPCALVSDPIHPSSFRSTVYLQNNKPQRLHMINIFTCMIHVSIPLVCLSPAKSPLHNLLDRHDNNPAQGFSPLKENYFWPLWHARAQVKYLETILIGTEELTATLIRLYRSGRPVFSSKVGKRNKKLTWILYMI